MKPDKKQRAEIAAFDWGCVSWSNGDNSEQAQELCRKMWRAFRAALKKEATK